MEISFTSIRGNLEEENTVKLLQHIASEAGFYTEFAYIDEVEFDNDGIFFRGERYELWFKLIPWEDIALEEPDLAMLINSIIKNQEAIIFNPAYTLLFQSKGILLFYGNFSQTIHFCLRVRLNQFLARNMLKSRFLEEKAEMLQYTQIVAQKFWKLLEYMTLLNLFIKVL